MTYHCLVLAEIKGVAAFQSETEVFKVSKFSSKHLYQCRLDIP